MNIKLIYMYIHTLIGFYCVFYLNKYAIYVYAHTHIHLSEDICGCLYAQLPWQMLEERIKLKEVSTLEFMYYAQSADPMIYKIMFCNTYQKPYHLPSHHKYSGKRDTNIAKKFSGSIFYKLAGKDGKKKR